MVLGRIFCIKSAQTDKVYIGSTLYKTPSQLIATLRYAYKNGKCFSSVGEIMKFDDAKMVILEKREFVDKVELRKLEDDYIKKFGDLAVNMKKAYLSVEDRKKMEQERSKKDYYDMSKYDYNKARRLKNYYNNREHNLEKINEYGKKHKIMLDIKRNIYRKKKQLCDRCNCYYQGHHEKHLKSIVCKRKQGLPIISF